MADRYQENCPWRIKGYSSPHSCQCAACPNRHDGTTCYATDNTDGYRLGKEDTETEPLTCTGCCYLDEQCAPCASCIRATKYADYYRRPPEGEEDSNV